MDIEDIAKHGDPTDSGRAARPAQIFPRRKNQQKAPSFRRKPCADGGPAFLPETKRVYVRTFGCSHNGRRDAADAWVVNSCTVKDPSQAAFMKEVRRGMKDGKAVVVSGCIPQGERGLVKKQGGRKPPELDGASSVGIKQIGRVNEAVAAALRGETFHALGSGPLPSLELPKVRANALVEIVPLSSGCLRVPPRARAIGSGAVLAKDRMNREYTVADFRAVVDGLAARVDGGLSLMTDVICGFPARRTTTSTRRCALVEDYAFGLINISQFYARPGTPAASMKRVHTATVADGGARLVCHTKTYAKVLVPFDRSLVGARLRCESAPRARWHVGGVVLRVLREADAAGRPALRDACANLDGRLARDAPPKDATAAAPAPAPSSARRPGVASVLLAVLPALAAALWWSIF
ncbi:tRNA (N(6)-L-threonylcarbamoyladenosine(37)-C(2))-methylthiotransferase [Aureococcus anophagefferens]|uniref:tRNA (N(6)-L-threonylcarbamoyladenosine(37)-C(2))-methylthiotransferase n=1 Tax=Aureococcus anophagefferens TaxID=44056 RepID=A0ABR1FY03_AURAN